MADLESWAASLPQGHDPQPQGSQGYNPHGSQGSQPQDSTGQLHPASDDASFRRYFRHSQLPGIFADVPQSEKPEAFVMVAAKLKQCGLNVPVVQAVDMDKGFLWLTDLGSELYLYSAQDKKRLYQDAIDALVQMQKHVSYEDLPCYDKELLLSEMHLFRDWLLHSWLKLKLDDDTCKLLDATFNILCETALAQPVLFVHRDYHSRNLMYCPDNNPGILDFQDAVLGPYSYDLVSLLKDCYIVLDNEFRESLLQYYLASITRENILQVKPQQLRRDFDFMGVQRHLKAAGIFARLSLRDNKHGYLQDIPRTLSYITRLQGCYLELDWLAHWLESDVLKAVEAKL